MNIIICPGIHESAITQSFLQKLRFLLSTEPNFKDSENILIFPAQNYSALSTFHILQFLSDAFGGMLFDHATQTQSDHRFDNPQATSPLLFISFSAGVVGAIGAAWGWQLLGGKVKAFIALDGWGVPLFGNFPIHRLSHNYFTYWSSALLGSGEDSFYADPPVEHLEMWRSPQSVQGYWVHPTVSTQPQNLHQATPTRLTAGEFLTMLIERYGEEDAEIGR